MGEFGRNVGLLQAEGGKMVKEQFREAKEGGRIGSVGLRAGSSWEMREAGVVEVLTKELYQPDATRTPAAHGPLDLRLGLSSTSGHCGTCQQDLNDCVGHFGFPRPPAPRLSCRLLHAAHPPAPVHLQTLCPFPDPSRPPPGVSHQGPPSQPLLSRQEGPPQVHRRPLPQVLQLLPLRLQQWRREEGRRCPPQDCPRFRPRQP